jgi:aminoglycoside phosphotransferase family enzyme/predicted kinase
LQDLLRSDAYPHDCESIELIETHISWVLLAGDYAYKIKKPVDFGFLDFSTLDRRRHFCDEELRLNRRFAESLYVDVVAITRVGAVARIGGDGEAIEWAVRMRRFPSKMQLDRRLAAGKLAPSELGEFGATLARVHATLPTAAADSGFGTADAVLGPVRENFLQIRASRFASVQADLVDRLDAWSTAKHAQLAAAIEQRRRDGFVRECHGDLHLSNLVLLDDGIHAFDCIEFSAALRWLDLISDAAFLMMDCCVRDRADLGYAFLDRYLEQSGDYAGGALLGFYLVYRSMVRAKVAALQAQRADDVELLARYEAHLGFARDRALRSQPAVILMCGVSGSGKSWLAQRLIERIPAIRIRSDVERKRLAALEPLQRSGSALDQGLYTAQNTDALYAHLEHSADALVSGGERVIVDATFLSAARRDAFRRDAQRRGVAFVIVHCTAPRAVLVERITRRNDANNDPSEADVAVLDVQLGHYEPPASNDATVLTIDTSQPLDVDAIARRVRSQIERHT